MDDAKIIQEERLKACDTVVTWHTLVLRKVTTNLIIARTRQLIASDTGNKNDLIQGVNKTMVIMHAIE